MINLKKIGQFVVYEAIKDKYGEEHCFVNQQGELAYVDDTRIFSLYIFRNLYDKPLKCYIKYFDKNENFIDEAVYRVTSYDEVIERFIDEIEEM